MMKKFFLTAVAAFFIAILISMPLHAETLKAETLKIGVYDIQKIIKESKTVGIYRRQLERDTEPRRQAFSAKQEAARQIEEKLKKDGQAIPPAEKKSLEEKLAIDIKELMRLKEAADAEVQKIDRELVQKALNEINEVIGGIAKKENYTIIFEKNAAGIAHLKDSVDITEKVIKAYDKR